MLDKPKPNLDFKIMALTYKIRDFLLPRMKILEEVGIKPGFHVLDYGCGPGSYIIPLTELVGSSGKIYALDIHPLAIQRVRDIAAKNKLTNVDTIHSGCKTGLPNEIIDVILLYDILHNLGDSSRVLKELHRVLKPSGILSFNDHHMKEENEIIARVTHGGLFRLSSKGERVYNFVKAGH